jgi:hypothetical protein
MSIFTKIFEPIVRPIIRKEIKKGMKELLQPIIDLIKALVTPQQGTKFLVTVIGIGAVTWLCYKGIATLPAVIGIVAMAIAYHLSNIYLTNKSLNGNATNGNGAKPPGNNGNGVK